MYEDTPEFVARYIVREARTYLDSLAPPFFRALVHYANDGSLLVALPRPLGRRRVPQEPGRPDVPPVLRREPAARRRLQFGRRARPAARPLGPVAASERNAARIFNADQLFFVTNGTSTSNKMVWHATVAPGDIVVVDRNCHKSILHAITMTGAIPVFLTPTRNHFGIIGPISRDEFRWENIEKKIRRTRSRSNVKTKPRILTLTQSTYDGILYNVDTIKDLLDGRIDTLHFDEAWLPHATFHEFYRDMHAIGKDRPRSKDALIFSTQSTHKLLAGLSQASQILVQDSETRSSTGIRFNEAYLMHTSTSPQYAIIASCDVAAAMMEPPGGPALVEESIIEALDFRRAMRKVDEEFGDSWWFKVWGPERLAEEGIGNRDDWMLAPNERWHGFGDLAAGFNMLDPIKATVLTPGARRRRRVRRAGHPGGDRHQVPRRARHRRREDRAVLVLHHVHDRHHQGPLEHAGHRVAAVQGRLRREPAAVARAARVRAGASALREDRPARAVRRDPRHLQGERHRRLTTEMYLSNLEPAMKPADAYARMAHREIERVEIDDLEGRVTSALLTPYPPGIPLLIPGERFNQQIVKYLKFARDFNERFPGFDTDIHGLVEEEVNGRQRYFVDCVARAKVIAAMPPMTESTGAVGDETLLTSNTVVAARFLARPAERHKLEGPAFA